MNLPPYTTFPTLVNDKIALRQIVTSDLSDLIEISFYDAKPAKTVAQAAEMHDRINEDYSTGNSIHWGIIDTKTQKIVGTCGYYRGFVNSAGELGCVLLPQYQGRGFMTAALLLAIDFGIKTIGLQRIWAATDRDNAPAIRLLERLGFVKTAQAGEEIEYMLGYKS